MSLNKQLWIGIVLLMMFAFSGSFFVSSTTLKRGVEQQLRIKNIDNANSLALAATQLATDQTMVELLLAAQFDGGHYQYIRWESAAGETLLVREHSGIGGTAPAWFKALVDIEAHSGVATIQAGWQQMGTIHLQSDPAFAYQTLWDNTLRLFYYFLAAVPICGLAGHLILRVITHPLHDVVIQARALRQRRYTKVALPRTQEFRELVVSMNELSDEVKLFFDTEASQLFHIREESAVDEVSGVFSREHFLHAYSALLEDEQKPESGVLSLFRLHDLQALNRSVGHKLVDIMLGQLGAELNALCSQHEHWLVGRLNGSDFVVLSPGSQASDGVAEDIQKVLLGKLEELDMHDGLQVPASAYEYHAGESLSQILSRADSALAVAEGQPESQLEVASHKLTDHGVSPLERWRQILVDVIDRQHIAINYAAVISKEGQFLHYSASGEYEWEEEQISEHWLRSWSARLARSAELDQLLISRVVEDAGRHKLAVAITLSQQTLQSAEKRQTVLDQLAGLDARRLIINIPEYFALRELKLFKQVCAELLARSFRVGLTHAGQHVESIGQLYDCGLSHIVLDNSITDDIQDSVPNQILARGLATVFHSIGIRVYAEGIQSEPQWAQLDKLGIDGGFGPYADTLLKAGRG